MDTSEIAVELRQPTPTPTPSSTSTLAASNINPRSPPATATPPAVSSASTFRSNSLSIDVNVPESAVPSVLASPLTIFATKRLPTNPHRAHPVATLASDRKSRPHAALTSPLLQYGMVVSLVSDDRNGVIAAEGFASCDVRLERLATATTVAVDGSADAAPPKLGLGGRDERQRFERGDVRLTQCSYRDCLFEVVPKMMYDATLSLQERGGNRQGHTATTTTTMATAALTELQFKSDAELRLNAMTYRRLKGTNVMYGHVSCCLVCAFLVAMRRKRSDALRGLQVIQLRHVNSGRFLSADATMIPLRGAEYSQVG
ncbi:hypothetical protein PINS_up010470 [Pythium insidiosum]|nr:hypothetical protein PINS_up010470 [Pythium insidiosum]